MKDNSLIIILLQKLNELLITMIKHNFQDDYGEGCHHSILKAMLATNLNPQNGYGDDDYTKDAKKNIKQLLDIESVDIHFVTGGTQANLIVISSILRTYESVISANTGHINTHEAGAIEATGHKINTIESNDGKITISDIKKVLDEHTTVPHMVKPKLVYISNSTELGTIYKKQELTELSNFCKENSLFLFLDGARLGSALTSSVNDLTLTDIASLTDVFYIGGTKNGALLGEAIIINNNKLKEEFDFNIKQKGALLAKGRLLGIQFRTLFTNNLYFELAKHANLMSQKMAKSLKQKGFLFLIETESNQIFPVFSNQLISQLNKKYKFHIWKKIDKENSAIRLVTSWATKETIVNEFLSDLQLL